MFATGASYRCSAGRSGRVTVLIGRPAHAPTGTRGYGTRQLLRDCHGKAGPRHSGRMPSLVPRMMHWLTHPGEWDMTTRRGNGTVLVLAVLVALGTLAGPVSAAAVDDDPVDVLVSLDVPWTPEGELDVLDAATQRLGVDRAVQNLVSRLDGVDLEVRRTYRTLPVVAATVSRTAMAALEEDDRVASITPDELALPRLEESVAHVGADAMHADLQLGLGTTVAVLDTGVDLLHPMLLGSAVAEACFSVRGSCPGGGTEEHGVGAARPCAWAPAPCGHGTSVAAVAVGRLDPLGGRTGVAPGAGLLPIQVFSRQDGGICEQAGVDPCAVATTSDVLAALDWLAVHADDHDVAAVNLSFGTGETWTTACADDPRHRAVEQLRSLGVVTVVAAGNGGSQGVGSPACLPSALAIGSTTLDDQLAGSTNRGPMVDLVAPGVGIDTAGPSLTMVRRSGTSMAAPHVAGAVALLSSVHPHASADVLVRALREGAVEVDDPDGLQTYRRLDVPGALASLERTDARPGLVEGLLGGVRDLIGTLSGG